MKKSKIVFRKCPIKYYTFEIDINLRESAWGKDETEAKEKVISSVPENYRSCMDIALVNCEGKK